MMMFLFCIIKSLHAVQRSITWYSQSSSQEATSILGISKIIFSLLLLLVAADDDHHDAV